MSRERRAIELFERVLEHGLEGAACAEFLANACGDDVELRREVDSLLATREDASGLLPPSRPHDGPPPGPASPRGYRLQAGLKLLDRYEILDPIGTGGMGEVYRAKDGRLGRVVAIKVLNSALTDDRGMQDRFDREMRSVAALTHPQVVALHDIAEHGDIKFAVMELVEGRTLRELIAEGMSWQDATRVALDVAAGLEAAHARNIMHRDIKPDNVIVTDNGRAKVLDFGLARQEELPSDQLLTVASAAPGTMPYMSPEQAEHQDVGCATDIFSLGTVIYEMLAGENPFRRASAVATLREVAAAAPPAIAASRVNAPEALLALLARMHQREPSHRPTASEVQQQLRAICGLTTTSDGGGTSNLRASDVGAEGRVGQTASDASTRSKPEPPSVSVLPFDNLSGNEDDYFVDGMTEDITTALSRFGSLLVIARSSAFAQRDRAQSLQDTARALRAQFIVQGSVRRAGKRVRITVQLVEASTGTQVWAQRFDRELEDIFVVQDEVTATVVSTLAGRVEASRLAHARRMPPDRLDAYDYVLRGKDHHHRNTAQDCEAAIDMFERAIERDPEFAPAHAWLACGFGQARAYRPAEHDALVARAQQAAERARDLDSEDAECHRVLANVALVRHDLPRAQSHQERGLSLNPNDDRQLCAMGQILCFRGEHAAAVDWIERAMRLNPFHSEPVWLFLGRALFHQGRCEEALGALEHITGRRLGALVYRVAACARLDGTAVLKRHVDGLTSAYPEFDLERFLAGIPYEHEADRNTLRRALRDAGL